MTPVSGPSSIGNAPLPPPLPRLARRVCWRPAAMSSRLAEPLDDVYWNGAGLDAVGLLRMTAHPDARFEPFDGELRVLEQPMAHLEARAAPFADRALDFDILAEY